MSYAQTGTADPLRVLFVSHTFPPKGRPLDSIGGMQRVAVELHRELTRQADVDVEALVLRSAWRWVGLRTPPFCVEAYRRVRRALKRDEADLVLFSSVVTAPLALALGDLARQRGVPLLAIAHGQDALWPLAPYRTLVERTFGRLDGLVAVSRATGQACLRRGLDPGRLEVIPNGIDFGRFAGGGRLGLAAALPEDAFLLCSVGRQVERKGFSWFVGQVMPRLPERVHYWLAGEGPERANIQRQIDAQGLGHRVRLLGRLADEEVAALYRTADLFVMPNIPVAGTMEGFGVVMLEAGTCGLPTVASRLEGICDVVADGHNGRLVESGDAAAFAGAIEACAADPDGLRQASAGTRRYVQRFGWEAIARRYVDLFARLCRARLAGCRAEAAGGS